MRQLDESDILVVLGDCALVEWPHAEAEGKYQCDWLNEKPWTTILLYGNHDNYEAIKKYPVVEKFGGYVREIIPDGKVFALDFPAILNLNGHKTLLIPGANSHDIDYLCYSWEKDKINRWKKNRIWHRVVGESWWPEEKPNCAAVESLLRDNLGIWPSDLYKRTKIDKFKVDFILTHDCPASMTKLMCHGSGPRMIATQEEKFLEDIKRCANFKYWFHGHMHTYLQYGADRIPCRVSEDGTEVMDYSGEDNIFCIYDDIAKITNGLEWIY